MKRRDFLKAVSFGGGASPFLASFAAAAETGPVPTKFKITQVKSVRLKLVQQLGTMEQISSYPPLRYTTNIGGGSFTEIHTDQGVIGIGPGVDAQTITRANQILVGADPFDMNDHAFRLYSGQRRGGGSIELALWDLIGKATGQPLYKLWGGAVAGAQTQPGRNTVMPYASQWTVGSPDDRAREAARIKAQGYKAMKLKLGLATVKQDVALMEAARKVLGDDFILMCDANKAGPYGIGWPAYPWNLERAVETARGLAPLNLTWLEEPLPRFDYDQLAELNKMRLVPLAGGENNVGIDEFLTILQKGCFDWLQPEVLAVGPTMIRTIAGLAAAYDVKIVPHGGSGGVCWLGLMHLICSLPNAPMQEIIHEPPAGDSNALWSIFTDPPVLREGYYTLPDGPGLGLTIRPDLILPD